MNPIGYDLFIEDINKTAPLRDENILSVFGICQSPTYLITENPGDTTLFSYLNSQKDIETSTQNQIIHGIASGLNYLHKEGIVIRDLSSRTVYLNKDLVPKIQVGESRFRPLFSKDELEYYAKIFSVADHDGDGFIGKADASYLTKGNVSKENLVVIWEYSKTDTTGMLTRNEFYCALRLVALVQIGQELTPNSRHTIHGNLFPKFSDLEYPKENSASFVRWLAPETILKCDFTEKSDIWSFGCILIEILTNQIPFSNIKSIQNFGPELCKEKSESSKSHPTVELPQDSEGWIKELISKCTSYEPSERPSAKEIVSKIQKKK